MANDQFKQPKWVKSAQPNSGLHGQKDKKVHMTCRVCEKLCPPSETLHQLPVQVDVSACANLAHLIGSKEIGPPWDNQPESTWEDDTMGQLSTPALLNSNFSLWIKELIFYSGQSHQNSLKVTVRIILSNLSKWIQDLKFVKVLLFLSKKRWLKLIPHFLQFVFILHVILMLKTLKYPTEAQIGNFQRSQLLVHFDWNYICLKYGTQNVIFERSYDEITETEWKCRIF